MIYLYTSPSCYRCIVVKSFLHQNNIPFREIDVSRDEESLRHLMDYGFLSLPVIEVDETLFQVESLGTLRSILVTKGYLG